MGNLLRILLSTDPPSKGADIFVDFESKNILIINFVQIYNIYILLYILCGFLIYKYVFSQGWSTFKNFSLPSIFYF